MNLHKNPQFHDEVSRLQDWIFLEKFEILNYVRSNSYFSSHISQYSKQFDMSQKANKIIFGVIDSVQLKQSVVYWNYKYFTPLLYKHVR